MIFINIFFIKPRLIMVKCISKLFDKRSQRDVPQEKQ
jgi:hypothetical protein